ncbi:MAG: XRE family transcriptional regulator [Aquabacterium sp.]|nr:MAG: XRE family transcriptional regulator [Aquabacterium sp.]TAL13481.1 MAG: XRE family transcriptional regulator [Aquabacterium sp.]
MSTRPKKPQRGRPPGSRSFDAEAALAFGAVVKAMREANGQSQELLALRADVERSYYGRIERGESQPTLFVILKVANALGVDSGALVSQAEHAIRRGRRSSGRAFAQGRR